MLVPTLGVVGQRRRITLQGLAAFYCSLLLLTLLLVWSEATTKVDRLLHDTWVRYSQREVPSDVIIAAIDSHSLNQLGRWPWPRQLQARLFEQIASHKPRVMLADLLYTEAAEQRDDDVRLGASIRNLPLTVLPVLTERGGEGGLIESLPVSDITRQVSTLGHVYLPIDDDGIVRRVYLKAGINQPHWPTLGLAGLDILDEPPDPLPGAVTIVSDSVSKWVHSNEVFIPFYGGSGSFRRVPASDIINGTVSQDWPDNAVVFVGLTASGLGDVVPTPVSVLDQPVPGVEIHANVFSALRDGLMVTQVNPYMALVVAFVLLLPMLFVYSRAPPEWGLISAAISSVIPVAISFLLYRNMQLWLPPLAASVPILASYLLWSRHRLQYVNRFLEREQERAAEHVRPKPQDENAALVDFFKSASRHLPIEAWRFSIGREVFQGGLLLPAVMPVAVDGRWVVHRSQYVRRYPAEQDLLIEMLIRDEKAGEQIAQYVDSLARVRAREQASILRGSIERLQTNVLTLTEQLEWLRSVKVFSDAMLTAAPSGFAVWNPAGECIRSNELISQLVHGYAVRGALIDFIACLGRQPEKGEDAEHLRDLVMHKKPWQIAYREDERELIINFRAVGQTLAKRLVCVSVVDVSDIRTAEKARAEIVDYLSHDLRSPLISALYLLEPDADSRIASNIQHSLAMMDNLLHVARADSLSESLFTPLLLNGVLDNTLDQLLPQARKKGIRLEVKQEDEELWVVGDASSLERAFTNIVGNAIKYSPQGTLITIMLVAEAEKAILTVDDQGVGIDPAMLDLLFTRFKRDAATASDHKGLGLGLALVARVVRLHAGQVSASNLPVGTRITLEIPLEPSDASVEQQDLAVEIDQTPKLSSSG